MLDDDLIAEAYAMRGMVEDLARRVDHFIDRAQDKQRRNEELKQEIKNLKAALSAARGERDE